MTLLQRLWVLGLLLGCASAQGADLITVYREAARTNPQLAAAAASLQAVRERRPQAIAGLLPSIDASGAIERQRLKDRDQAYGRLKIAANKLCIKALICMKTYHLCR